MSTRLTVAQLERMKTHELADLLAEIVLVLRRMPDVECRELGSSTAIIEEQIVQAEQTLPPATLPEKQVKFMAAELEAKKVADLKEIAKNLHLTFTSKSTKKNLSAKSWHDRSRNIATSSLFNIYSKLAGQFS